MELNLTEIYIERSNKETEELIAEETTNFLTKPISYLKENMSEFLYIESPDFSAIKFDALSLEVDDIFKTYMVLLGLKVQKKHASTIKSYLDEELNGEILNYSIMFSGEDGLWDVNIPINYIEGFNEEMTIEQVLTLTSQFIEKLVKIIDQPEHKG